MVYALSLAAGLVTALDNPTRQSFYMELVPESDLTNAVSLNSAVFMGSRIVGASIAGAVIATIGIAACFLIDGVSYIAVIGALLAMRTAVCTSAIARLASGAASARGFGTCGTRRSFGVPWS